MTKKPDEGSGEALKRWRNPLEENQGSVGQLVQRGGRSSKGGCEGVIGCQAGRLSRRETKFGYEIGRVVKP